MIAVLCALLSGGLFHLSQGLDDAWYLAWLAPAPILFLGYGAAPRWQLVLASLAAYAMGQIYLVQCYAPIFPPPVLALFLLTLAPLLLLFPLAVLFARFAFRRLPPLAALFAFPACWTAMEFLVGLVSPHGSYGALAYSQMSAPIVIQSASLFGMYAVSFLICLFANAIAIALQRRKGSLVAALIGIAICAANVAFGAVRLQAPRGETIRVAALSDVLVMASAFKADTLDSAIGVSSAYAAAVRAAAADGARIVATPEGGVLSKRSWDARVLAPLAAAARQTRVRIVAGVDERAPQGDIAIRFAPDGAMQRYDKRHLMPLIEAQYTPGIAPGLLGDGLAMTICKDMDFPRTIRGDAQGGIRLMIVPSSDLVHDGWTHGRLALMRGVENGFSVLRAANQGLLTASDAQGRILAQKTARPRDGMSSLVADLPLGPGPTLYTRIGDVFAWLCLVFTLAALAFAWRRAAKS